MTRRAFAAFLSCLPLRWQVRLEATPSLIQLDWMTGDEIRMVLGRVPGTSPTLWVPKHPTALYPLYQHVFLAKTVKGRFVCVTGPDAPAQATRLARFALPWLPLYRWDRVRHPALVHEPLS